MNILIGFVLTILGLFAYAYVMKPTDDSLQMLILWNEIKELEKDKLTIPFNPKYYIKDLIFMKLGTISYQRTGSWYTGHVAYIGILNHWFFNASGLTLGYEATPQPHERSRS